MTLTVQKMLADAEAVVPRISPEEAKALVGRADVVFLDVREPNEVAASGKGGPSMPDRASRAMNRSIRVRSRSNRASAARPPALSARRAAAMRSSRGDAPKRTTMAA